MVSFSVRLSQLRALCVYFLTLDSKNPCEIVFILRYVTPTFVIHLPCFTHFQKPLMLHGHERPVTQIKYNREGDLLFSAAKDHIPNVWYSLNGERLGSLNGHVGAVWCLDVNWESTHLMTGAADNSLKIWDISTGEYSTHLSGSFR